MYQPPIRVGWQHIAHFNQNIYSQVEQVPYLLHAEHFLPAEKCQKLKVEVYLRNPRTQSGWWMKYLGPQKEVLKSPCNKEVQNQIKSMNHQNIIQVLVFNLGQITASI